ncbi:flagellar export protein FliJ [Nitrincola tibetensis]|uniref:Flagellar FliJ protein n=1 Tax=Nitrincola tibetensis TaxID=2219697 RepID=A0A364NHH3_9GAMM|nr:flagellar export protein FliJ [Nitrincola tibetensis]RAU16569.1 flagellar export protein FliJ [Nitrincola tibetensis]
MTKKKSDRLALVHDLAVKKREKADQYLAESRQRMMQAETQLQQLESYLREYQEQFTQSGKQGFSSSQIVSHQAFISRLQHAVRQQYQTLYLARDQYEQVLKHWQHSYAQAKGLEKLHDKALDVEQVQRDKKEQRQIDERSQLTQRSGFFSSD